MSTAEIDQMSAICANGACVPMIDKFDVPPGISHHLGFGRIVASEIEVPIMLGNLV